MKRPTHCTGFGKSAYHNTGHHSSSACIGASPLFTTATKGSRLYLNLIAYTATLLLDPTGSKRQNNIQDSTFPGTFRYNTPHCIPPHNCEAKVKCTLTKVLCTLHTTHCKLHTGHCKLHTAYFKLHTEHCILHTAHCTQHTALCKLNTEN